jgi:hypothetical protein
MDAGSAAVAISALVVLSPAAIVGVVLRHREKMTALKNRQEGAPGLVAEVHELRNEMAQLRETTTRFDMSFDAALQRVEQRLDTVERGPTEVYPTYQPTAEETSATLRRG